MPQNNTVSRKRFLKMCGTAAASTALASSWSGLFLGCDDTASEYIILKNGSAYIEGKYLPCDILIRSGMVAEIDTTLTMTGRYSSLISEKSPEIIDCTGLYIAPGWVDMHCHIGGMGLDPFYLGPKMGVTALVDAGTYGPGTFSSFLKSYWKKSEIPMFCFLNVRKDGIKLTNMFTFNNPGVEDVEGAAGLATKYPDIIRGLKVRIDRSNTSRTHPTFLSETTARLGAELGLPVMYHLGESQATSGRPNISDFLANTKEGDIITHFLRSTTNSALNPSWEIRPEVAAAKSEGVRFDVGHGKESFMFDTAAAALDRGFTDFTISSDLHCLSYSDKALTFCNVISKFLALGLSIEDITEKASVVPRTMLGLEPSITLNKKIDMTVFSVRDESSSYYDAGSNKMAFDKRIYPEYTIVNGACVRAGSQDRLRF